MQPVIRNSTYSIPVFSMVSQIPKDLGMVVGLLGAFGLLVEAERRRSLGLLVSALPLLWYALAVRHNAAAAVLPSLLGPQALVPAIWPLEVGNALLVAERRKRLRKADTARFVELLSGLPIVIESATIETALQAVLTSGREFRLSSYDAAYLELAMRQGITLATRDKALRSACKKGGVELFTPSSLT